MKYHNQKILLISAILAVAWPTPRARAVDVTFEPDDSVPIVFVNVAIRTGSVNDSPKLMGISSFMAEMLRRGTTTKNKEQIDHELDQMGAQLEVETRAEFTVFRGASLSTQLEKFLGLLESILTSPSFDETEIAKLKSETISQLDDELGHDQAIGNKLFTRFLFGDHPYGFSIRGIKKTVAHFTQTDLRAHYERTMRDGLTLVLASGDTKTVSTEALIRGFSDHLKSKLRPGGDLPAINIPTQQKERRLLVIDKPDRTQTQIFGGQIGYQLTDPRFFALYLGNHIFGGGSFNSRLMLEIRVKHGWSYGAHSTARYGTVPRNWNFYLFPASKDTPIALETTLKLVQELKDKGVSQTEFQMARESLINGAGFMYDTPKKRIENTLLEKTLKLPAGFMRSYADHLRNTSMDDVNAALKDFLKPDQLSIAVLATVKPKGSKKSVIADLAKAAGVPESKVKVISYADE